VYTNIVGGTACKRITVINTYLPLNYNGHGTSSFVLLLDGQDPFSEGGRGITFAYKLKF
jgi:hypothetical protein